MRSETHTQRELDRDLEGTHIVTDDHRDTQKKTEIGGIHRNGFRKGGETKNTVSHSHTKSRIPRDKETGMWGDMRETQVVMEWSSPPTTLSFWSSTNLHPSGLYLS